MSRQTPASPCPQPTSECQAVSSTRKWWYACLDGSGTSRRRRATALADYSVTSLLAAHDGELRQLGLSRRELQRLRAMEALILRGRFERFVEASGRGIPQVSKLIIAELWGEAVETVVVAVLNIHRQPLVVERVHRGSVDACIVDPREVFRPALLLRGSSIMLGHNHPGGDPRPSTSDIELTDRLVDAGELLAIPVIDHIVVGGLDHPSWISFRDQGLITTHVPKPTSHLGQASERRKHLNPHDPRAKRPFATA